MCDSSLQFSTSVHMKFVICSAAFVSSFVNLNISFSTYLPQFSDTYYYLN